MEKLRIVVTGFIGLYPTGGVTWDYIQYPLGFYLMGHDVYYIEDTAQYSNFQSPGKKWNDSSDSIKYLKQTMEKFGLGDRWAYRDVASGDCFGLSLEKVLEVCRTADLFVDISASTRLRDEYLKIPKRILIDSDPMFTQVQYWSDTDPETSLNKIKKQFSNYNYLFTFGENINQSDCKIPTFNLDWEVTRQPICLNYWKVSSVEYHLNAFTTVMNWSTRKKMKYKDEEWGQKDIEFEKFIKIPKIFNQARFEIVLSVSADFKKNLNTEIITQHGWEILEPSKTINTASKYKSFINSSCGEFSVAKETYVKSNSGWFSCRSACYLAAGKPVITQETGWSKYIPSGAGLFAFTDTDSAIAALKEVTAETDKHSKAARDIAEEYFDSEKVLNALLNKL